MRKAAVKRETKETKIDLEIDLDGRGQGEIETGIGFLDHMMDLLSYHGRLDIKLRCDGDTHIDFHHTVEDIGIALGQVFAEALGDKRGITRYGSFILPIDEALVLVAIDFSGRSYLGFDLPIPTQKVGEFDTELVEEFFLGFTRASGATLHIKEMSGTNSHHIIEATFKAFGRAIKQAVAIEEGYSDEIPSTKGVL